MFPGDQVIERDSWLYDGLVPSGVVITRGNVFCGTGDYEDEPDVRDDRDVTTFTVWYESPPGSGAFPTGGGQFLSVEDAIAWISKTLPSPPRWE